MMAERILQLHAAAGGKSFVGIKFSENRIDFHYPETYRWNVDLTELKSGIPVDQISKWGDALSESIRDILWSIVLTKARSKEEKRLNDASDKDEPLALKSYMWIIRDFMRNGYYKNRENVYKTNQNGKISWKRTLMKQPIYSNGSFLYKDFVVSTKSPADDLMVEIHRFCVRKSIYLIGWLFHMRSSSMGVRTPEDVELSNTQKKQYVYTLQFELSRTFDDDKRERLSNMLNVVKGLNRSQNGALVYGVESFDHVFEAMIQRIYGTEESRELCAPVGCWSNRKAAVPLRPDSILYGRDENVYVIIDSKCYRYADEGYANDDADGLPATDSIQKQLTYGDQLLKTLTERGAAENTGIYNCFILPYDKSKAYGDKAATKKMLHYSGIYATGLWREASDQPYERIYVYFVDLRDVVDRWNHADHSEDQKALIKSLQDLAHSEAPAT